MVQWLKRNWRDIFCCSPGIFIFCLNKGFLVRNSSGVFGYFFKCYLNDLMAPIVVLAMSSMIFRWAGYEIKKFWVILLMGAFAALIWEFVIPLIKTNSTTDPNDLICYLVGTMVYYGIRKVTMGKRNPA